MATPQFLAHLGLTEEIGDEREIKRAYARLLKQIDQEANPEAFQKLREAYETSLGWFSWRQRQPEEEVQQEAIAASDASPATDDSPAARTSDPRGQHIDDALPPAQEAAPPTSPPEQEQPQPQAHAAALFSEHFSEPCREDDADTRLAACLEDDRLIDLEARAFFEYRVAHALAQGYTDGNHFLWMAAQAAFGWDEDHTRLRQFGRAGQVLENALNEQDFFQRQEERRRVEQSHLIERLRNDRPRDSELAGLIPALEWMLATFPNLMWITTSAENVQRWRDRHEKLPPGLKASQSPEPAPPEPDKKSFSVLGKAYIVLLLVVGLFTMVQMVDRDPPSPRPRAHNAGYRAFPQALARMTEPPVDPGKCNEAEQFARDYSLGNARADVDFGLAFDALMIDCADAGLWQYGSALDLASERLPRSFLPSARNQREELLRLSGQALPSAPTAQVTKVRNSPGPQKSP